MHRADHLESVARDAGSVDGRLPQFDDQGRVYQVLPLNEESRAVPDAIGSRSDKG